MKKMIKRFFLVIMAVVLVLVSTKINIFAVADSETNTATLKHIHTPEIIPAVKPTCKKTGLTEGTVCSQCGEVLVTQTVVSKIEHNYELIGIRSKSCTTDGMYTYKCKICREYKYEVIKASHEYIIYDIVDPTCTKTGYTKYICRVCDEFKIGNKTPLIDHKQGPWETITAPTMTEEGLEVCKCTECGEIVTQRPIEKLSYVFDVNSDIVILDDSKKIIYGFENGVENLEDYFKLESCEIEITPTKNGNGTGTIITVTDEGKIIKQYTVLVFGDVTGDGVTDAFDVSLIHAISNFESEQFNNSAQTVAGDLNGDGYIDIYDSALINSAMNFEYKIPQSK